jgi:hypothetical protein
MAKVHERKGDFDLGMMSLEHATALIESKVALLLYGNTLPKKFDCENACGNNMFCRFFNPRFCLQHIMII